MVAAAQCVKTTYVLLVLENDHGSGNSVSDNLWRNHEFQAAPQLQAGACT